MGEVSAGLLGDCCEEGGVEAGAADRADPGDLSARLIDLGRELLEFGREVGVGVAERLQARGLEGLKDNFWAINIGRAMFEGHASPLQHPDVLEALGDPDRRDLLSPYLIELIEGTRSIDRDEYDAARAWRDDAYRRLDEQFARFDFLVCPTAPFVAPERPDEPWAMPWETMDEYITNTALANILRITAVSMPAGYVDGLPVGLQLIGPRRSESLALRICHALEQTRPWAQIHPQIW